MDLSKLTSAQIAQAVEDVKKENHSYGPVIWALGGPASIGSLLASLFVSMKDVDADDLDDVLTQALQVPGYLAALLDDFIEAFNEALITILEDSYERNVKDYRDVRKRHLSTLRRVQRNYRRTVQSLSRNIR